MRKNNMEDLRQVAHGDPVPDVRSHGMVQYQDQVAVHESPLRRYRLLLSGRSEQRQAARKCDVMMTESN